MPRYGSRYTEKPKNAIERDTQERATEHRNRLRRADMGDTKPAAKPKRRPTTPAQRMKPKSR